MAAYADELRLAAHLGHFNVEGSNFLSLHGFLKDQYEAHTAEFDTLLELVRSMDFFAPKCRPCLQGALGREFIHPQSVDTREILVCYYRNLEAYGMAAKELGRLAKDTNAPDVENYAAELVESAFKGSWQVKSLLR
jgi:DNA-binding ferritin-like protein